MHTCVRCERNLSYLMPARSSTREGRRTEHTFSSLTGLSCAPLIFSRDLPIGVRFVDAGTHLCVVCTQVCRHTPVGTSVAGASPSLMGTDCCRQTWSHTHAHTPPLLCGIPLCQIGCSRLAHLADRQTARQIFGSTQRVQARPMIGPDVLLPVSRTLLPVTTSAHWRSQGSSPRAPGRSCTK